MTSLRRLTPWHFIHTPALADISKITSRCTRSFSYSVCGGTRNTNHDVLVRVWRNLREMGNYGTTTGQACLKWEEPTRYLWDVCGQTSHRLASLAGLECVRDHGLCCRTYKAHWFIPGDYNLINWFYRQLIPIEQSAWNSLTWLRFWYSRHNQATQGTMSLVLVGLEPKVRAAVSDNCRFGTLYLLMQTRLRDTCAKAPIVADGVCLLWSQLIGAIASWRPDGLYAGSDTIAGTRWVNWDVFMATWQCAKEAFEGHALGLNSLGLLLCRWDVVNVVLGELEFISQDSVAPEYARILFCIWGPSDKDSLKSQGIARDLWTYKFFYRLIPTLLFEVDPSDSIRWLRCEKVPRSVAKCCWKVLTYLHL